MGTPAAACGQLQAAELKVQLTKHGREQAVQAQHLGRLGIGADQAGHALDVGLGHIGLEQLALLVDHAGIALIAPQGHGLVLFEGDAQAVGKLPAHHCTAHPRHRLEAGPRLGQVHGEKVATQARRHIGAQSHFVAVRHITVHGDALQAEIGVAHCPPQGRNNEHAHETHQQQIGQGIHPLGVPGHLHRHHPGGSLAALHHRHGATPLRLSKLALAIKRRHRSS